MEEKEKLFEKINNILAGIEIDIKTIKDALVKLKTGERI